MSISVVVTELRVSMTDPKHVKYQNYIYFKDTDIDKRYLEDDSWSKDSMTCN